MLNPHRADRVVITKDEHLRLLRRSEMLSALEAGGVDNWEWYSESLQKFWRKHYPEDYDDAS